VRSKSSAPSTCCEVVPSPGWRRPAPTLVHGALATAAVVDVQMAAALVIGDEPDVGAATAQRSAELSRRHQLGQTLAAALALEAYAHARGGRRAEMQRCAAEARAAAPGVPDIEVKVLTAAAVFALVNEDRPTARHHLCGGLRMVVAAGGDCSAVPAIGLLGLLRAVDGADDEAPEVLTPEHSVHFMASAFLDDARAVGAGRRGEAGRRRVGWPTLMVRSRVTAGSASSDDASSPRPRSPTGGVSRWGGCARRSSTSAGAATSASPPPVARSCGRRARPSRAGVATPPCPASYGRWA
jgi:hypothetical protein